MEDGTDPKQPAGAYNLDVCRQAYLARLRTARGGHAPQDPTLAQLKAQLSEVDLEAARLRLAVAQGQVVPISAVGGVVGRAFVTLRQTLISLGSRVGDLAVACNTRGEVERLITAEVEQALGELKATFDSADWLKEAAKTVPKKLGRPTKVAAMLRDQAANGGGS